MQEAAGRLFRHAAIAIGRTRDRALEQAQNGAHPLDLIEGRDKMHFGCTGIGKANIDARRHQGPDQTFGTVHCLISL